MSDYKPIPVAIAQAIAERFDKSQVVIIAVDPVHNCNHQTSYGVSPQDKLDAAALSDALNQCLSGGLRLATFEDFRSDLGKVGETARGFPLVEFKDAYDNPCSLQCSSAIGEYEDAYERPGTSFLWVGIDDAKPQVLASKAAEHGVATTETTGWVPFPIPEDVNLWTQMHLNREQVRGLISRLEQWLSAGTFLDAPL